MREQKEIFPFDVEWTEMVDDILLNGGTLWIIERTDTNRFLYTKYNYDNKNHPIWECVWTNTVLSYEEMTGMMILKKYLFPTKELADRFAPKEIKEGGCPHCGNGAILIPIRLIEHKFE